ncbi:MAG: APC family permease, partial [Candidatus Limnocylindrales bacterium]
MADPVSSVAYAIEATLRALGGNLSLLLPTMGVVIGIIAIVVVNYQQIVARFPHGGGAASAVASSFGLGWAFMPLGALLVDFVLTIAISVAAATSAVIAFVPALGGDRVVVALAFLGGVASLTLLGHAGRMVFAAMTLAFLAVVSVLLAGASSIVAASPVTVELPSSGGLLAIVFAFPVGMALATGVEAPSSAIAQLGQLGDDGKRTFGRWTLWATLGFVSAITLGLTFAIVRLGIGLPGADSTLLADLARTASPPFLFALFQATSGTLLLAAASSSFQAGPGLLKSLARSADRPGVLPTGFGRTNRHYTPRLGVLVCLILAAAMVVAAGGHEQQLVLFYAVAVFASFLFGLAAMARLHLAEHSRWRLLVDLIALGLVGFTLAVNLTRG